MAFLHKVPLRQIQKLQREILHLAAGLTEALDEVVVGEKGGDGGEEAGGGVDERLADARRDGRDRGGRCRSDRGEGVHDSPYRSEEADERRGCRGRGEEGEIARQARRFDARGAQ